MNVLQNIFEFLVITVGVKMIVGHWVAERISKRLKAWFATTDRKQAIWLHYNARAAGAGHLNDNVLTCGQDKCAVFNLV